jgi:hypothetical protein
MDPVAVAGEWLACIAVQCQAIHEQGHRQYGDEYQYECKIMVQRLRDSAIKFSSLATASMLCGASPVQQLVRNLGLQGDQPVVGSVI